MTSTYDQLATTEVAAVSPLGDRQDLRTVLARTLGPMDRPRILLFGNYGNGNTGDDAILHGIIEDLKAHAEVTVASRQPEVVHDRHHVDAVNTVSLASLRAFARADIVAIGGGGIFGNGMKAITELLPFVALVAQRLGKDTMFVAIGAYSSAPLRVQLALKRVAATSILNAARDHESADVLGAAPAVLVADPAITLAPASSESGRQALQAAGIDPDGDILGISLKPTRFDGRNRAQVDLAVTLADWWTTERGGEVALICLSDRGDNGLGQTVTDVTMAEAVQAGSSRPTAVRLFGPNLEPTVVKAAMGELSAVVAHRLHAQIFAWAMGTPMAGISYERKADAFLEETGSRRVDLWHLDGAALVEWLATTPRPGGRGWE